MFEYGFERFLSVINSDSPPWSCCSGPTPTYSDYLQHFISLLFRCVHHIVCRTAATIQAQASCTTSRCTKFKLCLAQRQCEIGSITAITCEEGNPF